MFNFKMKICIAIILLNFQILKLDSQIYSNFKIVLSNLRNCIIYIDYIILRIQFLSFADSIFTTQVFNFNVFRSLEVQLLLPKVRWFNHKYYPKKIAIYLILKKKIFFIHLQIFIFFFFFLRNPNTQFPI